MKLRELREASGMSQTELACRVGVKSNTISMYESGKRSPKPEMLKQLATILKCSVDALLSDT